MLLLHVLPQPPPSLGADEALREVVERLDDALVSRELADGSIRDSHSVLLRRCEVQARWLAELQIVQTELESLIDTAFAAPSTGPLLLARSMHAAAADVEDDGEKQRRLFLQSMHDHVLGSLYPEDAAAVDVLFGTAAEDSRTNDAVDRTGRREAAMELKLEILRDMLCARLEERSVLLRTSIRDITSHLAEDADGTGVALPDSNADACSIGAHLRSAIAATEDASDALLQSALPAAVSTLHASLGTTLARQGAFLDSLHFGPIDRYLAARLRYGAAASGLLSQRVDGQVQRLRDALYPADARAALTARSQDTGRAVADADAELAELHARLTVLQARRTPAYLRALAEYDELERDCRDAEADIARLEAFVT